MTSLRPVPRDRDAEALYWLDLAKRVIGGEICPEDALQVLKSGDETLKRATTRSRVSRVLLPHQTRCNAHRKLTKSSPKVTANLAPTFVDLQ